MQRDMSTASGNYPVKQLVWALGMDPNAGGYFLRIDKSRSGSPITVYAGTKDHMKKLTISGGVTSGVLGSSKIILSMANAVTGEFVETAWLKERDVDEVVRITSRIDIERWQGAHAFGFEKRVELVTPEPVNNPGAMRRDLLLYKKRVIAALERF